MAKRKTAKTDRPAADGHPDTPSTTTSGGKTPTPADDVADAEAGAGTAVYPPSPGDQAGEKTDNVPPTKRLPPDVPPEEQGADELTTLRAENAALKAALSGLGINAAKVCEQAAAELPRAKAAKRGPTRTATVTPAGGSPVEVEYPADTPEEGRDAAAVEAYKRKAGIWSLATQPAVEHGAAKAKGAAADDDEKTTAKKAKKG